MIPALVVAWKCDAVESGMGLKYTGQREGGHSAADEKRALYLANALYSRLLCVRLVRLCLWQSESSVSLAASCTLVQRVTAVEDKDGLERDGLERKNENVFSLKKLLRLDFFVAEI